jgi:glycosyltransferase involved in cell wall biosynthesis
LSRRLLILCYFYPPLAGGGVHRVLSFTRYLPRHGWSCTVVCAGERDYWVVDPSLLERVRPDTEVVRVSGGSGLSAWLALRRRGSSGAGRRSGRVFGALRRLSDFWLLPDSYAGWSRRAARTAERLAVSGRFDAMLSSSPPDSVHLAALALSRRRRIPWVADFRDPWIGLHFRQPPTPWHRARQMAFERSVIEGADVVLAASRAHADDMGVEAGARARRVVHLPNGFEPFDAGADVGGVAPASALAHDAASSGATMPVAEEPDDEHRDGFYRMVFTGTLSQMDAAGQWMDALHDVLAARPEARRRIRAQIAGPYDVQYEDRAIALGLKGIVTFTGPMSHAESRALQRGADLLLLWKPGYGRTMVPGKTYEYLDAGRPVLALVPREDEAGALVRRAGGTVVDPSDRPAIVAAMGAMYDGWREGGRSPSRRPEWLDSFTRETLAGRLAAVLDETVENRS